ncbi:hypothetical protein [Tuwongella immobilis]|uniref:CRISPR-associated protein n=1 Tax=Tuwongella immobilis TaxID=692036 RepID=A0A6C2YLR3_9BACT|nr:hypothetical protein [Tuwongella immobilis]VIP02314.1 CRISPR-associated protein (Cas_Cas02710) OS=Rivularia sp. PCC 7116 GN=Riv7116_4960 PE=4 SV=1: Cas_Cas02710 [Tuwongella immobilis]VTS01028.1 CRISPR-associated protein (Cas_Cas02710) OS=Rivularia sp. PCC 7116 GN=Riv7116_4960 PE=4 SV=1: Cas_Cas02710 [Tuwongella immobilis]
MNPYISTLRSLFEPKQILPFVVGAVALSWIGSSLYDLLKLQLGEGTWTFGGILIGSVAILLFAAWILQRRLSRQETVFSSLDRKTPNSRRGLVVLVSREPVVRKAIEAHTETLQRVWLICTKESKDVGLSLMGDEALTRNHQIPFNIETLDDPYDPVACYQLVKRILADLPTGFTPEDLIADFTGMTALASIGMTLAATQVGVGLQYTPATLDANIQARKPLPPIEVTLEGTLPIATKTKSRKRK